MNKENSYQVWQGFHWSFFVNIQGLIICLSRFENYLNSENFDRAETELKTATDLMLASGAAMALAGSFSHDEYEQYIRPMMAPPHVKSADFSGLMSWDHACLMKLWKRLRPRFKSLPSTLKSQHEQFIQAYIELATAHKAVCEKFGGEETGSLRFDRGNAIKTLDKFSLRRLEMIAPEQQSKKGCPFH
ncbi:MAG: siderophore biosynthesis protein [Cyanobacteria bacterium J06592_8]